MFDTRALAWANQLEDGEIVFTNTANSDDIWSFGQILPMVLILLPVLSMFQSYRKYIEMYALYRPRANELQWTTMQKLKTQCSLLLQSNVRQSPKMGSTDNQWALPQSAHPVRELRTKRCLLHAPQLRSA